MLIVWANVSYKFILPMNHHLLFQAEPANATICYIWKGGLNTMEVKRILQWVVQLYIFTRLSDYRWHDNVWQYFAFILLSSVFLPISFVPSIECPISNVWTINQSNHFSMNADIQTMFNIELFIGSYFLFLYSYMILSIPLYLFFSSTSTLIF